MFIHTETDGSWLTAQGEAQVVIAQVKSAPLVELPADPSRPWVVATVIDLLGPKQGLAQIVSGTKPVILVLPELAVGFDDWSAIDNLVRGWTRPLVLITGFGFTKGVRLTEWLAQKGPTRRRAAWTATADERKYNGGWCWIHRPGAQTACVAFLKSTAEQYYEVQVEGLDQGEWSLAVNLRDLIIFPVICSDFLSIIGGERIVQHKIARHLAASEGNKRVLVVGLLLQKEAHPKWHTAILAIAQSINTERVNLCLVNASHEMCALKEDEDRWRDYSGMYIAKGRNAHLEHFPAVRRFETEQIDGAVVRTTSASVLGGPLRWDFGGATGRHIWLVQKDYGIADDGTLIESECSDRFRFETLRTIKRITVGHDAPESSKTQLARQCYEDIATQIRSAGPPNAELICKTLLYGEPGHEADERLHADSLSNFVLQLLPGMKSLGALKASAHMVWQTDAKQRGQLHNTIRGINVLVWCYPGLPISMLQTIRRWRAGVAPREPLVAFTKAVGTALVAPHPVSDRRQDISEAPSPRGRSVDLPAQELQIIELNLDEIESCFEQDEEIAFRAAVEKCLADGAAKLSAGGELHGR